MGNLCCPSNFGTVTFQHYTMLPNLSALSKNHQAMLVTCLLKSCGYLNEASYLNEAGYLNEAILSRNGVLGGLTMFRVDIYQQRQCYGLLLI